MGHSDDLVVVHLISSLRRGGRERQLATLYKYSKEKGITNKIICFNQSDESYVEEYQMESDVIYLTSRKIIQRITQIKSIITDIHPQAIWSWGGFEATFGIYLSLFSSIPHINGSIRHGIVKINRKQLWRMLLLHISKYRVANSKAGLKANRLKKGFVIYNGLDQQFLEKDLMDTSPSAKDEFACDEGDVLLISVANLVPYKDYPTVIQSLYHLKQKGYNNFHYIIVGEGPERDKISKLIGRMGMADQISLAGRRKDVKCLLRKADVFIHSSRGEGCSNAILEAMAAGLPVIATDTGGTSEIVEPANGIIFPYKDEKALAEAIEKLLINETYRKQLGQSGRKIAIQQYSVESLIKNYHKVLTEILQSG